MGGREHGKEAGQSFVVMLLLILPVLLLVLGLAYDLGNVAAGTVVAQNGVDLAAIEAAKVVDVDAFVERQEVGALSTRAVWVARDVALEVAGPRMRVDAVYAVGNVVHVEGEVDVRTPFLGMFLGRPTVRRRVSGVAEAAHGADRAGE